LKTGTILGTLGAGVAIGEAQGRGTVKDRIRVALDGQYALPLKPLKGLRTVAKRKSIIDAAIKGAARRGAIGTTVGTSVGTAAGYIAGRKHKQKYEQQEQYIWPAVVAMAARVGPKLASLGTRAWAAARTARASAVPITKGVSSGLKALGGGLKKMGPALNHAGNIAMVGTLGTEIGKARKPPRYIEVPGEQEYGLASEATRLIGGLHPMRAIRGSINKVKSGYHTVRTERAIDALKPVEAMKHAEHAVVSGHAAEKQLSGLRPRDYIAGGVLAAGTGHLLKKKLNERDDYGPYYD
jgi:hypothetical protein